MEHGGTTKTTGTVDNFSRSHTWIAHLVYVCVNNNNAMSNVVFAASKQNSWRRWGMSAR